MYVCMYVCVCVCMYVCIGWVHGCMDAYCVYGYMDIHNMDGWMYTYVSMCVCVRDPSNGILLDLTSCFHRMFKISL